MSKKPKALDKPKRHTFATQAEARKRTLEIKERFRAMAGAWWELGEEVKRCRDDHVPEALGVSFEDWMAQCFDESKAKVYRALRIADHLKAIPLEKRKLLNEGKAYELSRLIDLVPSADPNTWAARAADSSNKEFKASVDAVLKEKSIPPEEDTVRVVFVWPRTLAESMGEVEQKIAALLEVDIETKRGNRIPVWEAIAQFLLDAPLETLKKEGMAG